MTTETPQQGPQEPDDVHARRYGGAGPHEVVKVLEAHGITANAYLYDAMVYLFRLGKKEGRGRVRDLGAAINYLTRLRVVWQSGAEVGDGTVHDWPAARGGPAQPETSQTPQNARPSVDVPPQDMATVDTLRELVATGYREGFFDGRDAVRAEFGRSRTMDLDASAPDKAWEASDTWANLIPIEEDVAAAKKRNADLGNDAAPGAPVYMSPGQINEIMSLVGADPQVLAQLNAAKHEAYRQRKFAAAVVERVLRRRVGMTPSEEADILRSRVLDLERSGIQVVAPDDIMEARLQHGCN